MVGPDTWEQWSEGQLLTVGGHGRHLLIEFPHGLYVDIREFAKRWIDEGVQPILAHAERFPQLLHDDELINELIAIGCLVQVCSNSFVVQLTRADRKALKSWIRRGVVHVLGSDGHSCHGRPPRIRTAYETIRNWAGDVVADRICSTNGLAMLQGRRIKTIKPRRKRSWFLVN